MNIQKKTLALGVVLFVSLALNVYAGGLFLGHHFGCSPYGDKKMEWARKDKHLREKMSDSDRDILRQSMAENRQMFREKRAALDAARKNVYAAMNADPFDKAAFDKALQEEMARKAELMTLMREKKADVLEKLSPEGREIFRNVRQAFPEKEGRFHHRPADMPAPKKGLDNPAETAP